MDGKLNSTTNPRKLDALIKLPNKEKAYDMSFLQTPCNPKHPHRILDISGLSSGGFCPSDKHFVVDLSDDEDEGFDWVEYLSCPMETHGAAQTKPQATTNQSGNQGNITLNYYANTYQNSIDLSGQASSNGGNKPTPPINTLSTLVSSIGDISNVAGMLMDPDTEETTQLSDRVASQTRGNTLISTQSTVGRLLGYGRSLFSSEPTSCADIATKNLLAAERWYTGKLAEWTKGQTVYRFLAIDLPHALLERPASIDGGVFASTTHRHFLLKCGWRVQVQCNASNFHQGCLLVCLAPEFAATKDNRRKFNPETNLYEWIQPSTSGVDSWVGLPDLDGGASAEGADGIAIQNVASWCGTNPQQWPLFPHQYLNLRTNTTVDLEVPYVNCVPSSDPTIHSPWTLLIAVVSPLDYAEGSSPVIDITASISPVNPIWNGLRYERSAAQGPIPTNVRENQYMFLTTVPDCNIPAYGNEPTPPTDYMPGEVTDFRQLFQVPTLAGISTDHSGSEHIKTPIFSVSNTVSASPLVEIPVTLSACALSNTFIGSAGRCFANYRGTIRFHFTFTGTAMARGKFLLSYCPPRVPAPTTLQQAQQCTSVVWDLGLQSTFTFHIPFISVSDFRFTQANVASVLNIDGWVTVFQLTPLTYPVGCPSSSFVMVSVSAGDDFVMRNPVNSLLFDVHGNTNIETGDQKESDATDDYAAVPVELPCSHTNLKFFYDRCARIAVMPCQMAASKLSMPNSPASKYCAYVLNLGPHPSYGPFTLPCIAKQTVTSQSPQKYMKYCPCDREFFSFSPFTYFKADLEVTVRPEKNDCDLGIEVVWFPPGAPLDTSMLDIPDINTPNCTGSRLPIGMRKDNRGTVSFTIPYSTVLSLQTTAFNGYNSYSSGAWFGVSPGIGWGSIIVFQRNTVNAQFASVYIRYKNFRAFCPRPAWYLNPNHCGSRSGRVVTDTAGNCRPASPAPGLQVLRSRRFNLAKKKIAESGDVEENPGPVLTNVLFCLQNPRYRLRMMLLLFELFGVSYATYSLLCELMSYDWDSSSLITLSGDVELNPGPFMFQPQGPKRSKEQDSVDQSQIKALLGFLDADSASETALKGWEAVRALQDMWQKAKAAVDDKGFWVKFLKKLTKMLCGFWAFARTEKWDVKAAMSIAWALDFFSEDGVVGWMLKHLKKVFSTSPPPLPKELAVFDPEGAHSVEVEEEPEEKTVKKIKKIKNLFKIGKKETLEPQGPMDVIKDMNIVALLMKNGEWLLKTVKSFINWITSWFKKEEEKPEVALSTLLESFPEQAAKIDKYRRGAAIYPGDEPYKYMDKLYELASSLGKVHIAGMADKFRLRNSHADARVEPVVVVLRGRPGAGKSICAQVLAQAISKMVTGKQSVYALPPDSDYFDGYENQFCVIMDDLGQNPDGKDFATFCQMVSTTNFLPAMAAVENKGTPFTSQVIIVTTNLVDFRPVTVSDPGAVKRRLTFEFEVVPDSDFTIAGKLDIEGALRETGPGYGPYTFTCPLLDEAVLFHPRSSTVFERPDPINLEEVVNTVVSELDKKKNTTDILRRLVAQGGDDLDMSRYADVATQTEISETITQSLEFLERKSEWMKISAIILGAAGALVTLGTLIYKFVCGEKKEEEKPENQTPYDGKALKVKAPKDLIVLDVNGPTPTFDFEAYVSNKLVYQIGFYFPNSVQPGIQSALAVKGRTFLVNQHIFKNPEWTHFSINGQMIERDIGYKSLEFWKNGRPTDVVMVQLSSGPQFKDNVTKFVPGKFDIPQNSDLIGVSKTGGPFFFSGKYIGQVSTLKTTIEEYAHMFRYKCNTFKGWCGSAMVAQVGSRKCVIGLHSAGACGVAGASIVTQEMILKGLEALEGEFKMETQGALTELENGPHVFVPRKTNLKKTFAFDVFKPAAGPAVLSNKDKRLTPGVDFDKVIWSKHTQNIEEYPMIFKIMAIEYANRVFTELGTDNGPLTLEEAIKGIDGLEKMDPKTSPGLPYTLNRQSRPDLLDFELGIIVDSEAKEEYEKYCKNDYSKHLFQSFLKDEIRPEEKVKAGKTRMVDVASVMHCVRGRSLLGRFASRFQTNPGTALGSAIGCDPDIFWTKIVSDLSPFKHCFDVDYSAFDSSHGSGIFDILSNYFFTAENGFDADGVKAFLDSLAHSTHAYEDKRYKIDGALPSGCSATSMINTIINNIVIRSILALSYKNFHYDDIKILAYGDDLLVATDLDIDFNHVAKHAATVGYKMTPASKSGSFPLTSTLADCTFLKRKFVVDRENEFLIRPQMDSSNLETMLSFYRPGTLRERLDSVCMLAVHSGPNEYDRLFKPYRDALMHIPSWSFMDWCWRRKFT